MINANVGAAVSIPFRIRRANGAALTGAASRDFRVRLYRAEGGQLDELTRVVLVDGEPVRRNLGRGVTITETAEPGEYLATFTPTVESRLILVVRHVPTMRFAESWESSRSFGANERGACIQVGPAGEPFTDGVDTRRRRPRTRPTAILMKRHRPTEERDIQ